MFKILAITLLSPIFVVFPFISGNCQGTITDSLSFSNSIEGKITYGLLLPHQEGMAMLREHGIKSFEVSFGSTGSRQKSWQSVYNYPEVGIAYQFMDLGSYNYLGFSHSIVPNINFFLTPKEKLASFSFKIGSGVSYNTKKYSTEKNPFNTAISTPLNVIINLSAEGRFRISQTLSMMVSGNLTHYSNGTFKKPNSGLNIASFSLGVNHCFQKQTVISESKENLPEDINRWIILGACSRKEVRDPGGPKFSVFSGSLEYSRYIKPLKRVGVSLDVMYDMSTQHILHLESIPFNSYWELYKFGGTLQAEFILQRLSAIFAFGSYAFNKNPENGFFYQRLGLRYHFADRGWLHLALKTHWNLADYIELGVGVRIN